MICFCCLLVFLLFSFFCNYVFFQKKSSRHSERSLHSVAYWLWFNEFFFYLFISSFLFNLSYLEFVPTLILGCFHSVYTINCWSSGLATSTWTYWAARSLVGLIAKLLLLPRPVLLLPLLKKKMLVKKRYNMPKFSVTLVIEI